MSEDKITRSDIDEILRIVASIDHLVDFHLKYGELELRVTREGARIGRVDAAAEAAPTAPAPIEPSPQPEGRHARAGVPEGMAAIKAPMVGTLYRAPAPGAKAFVQPGDAVERDTVVCIIEVMKLMNSIRAGVAGTVREIRVENGEPVEFGQVLLVIEPHA